MDAFELNKGHRKKHQNFFSSVSLPAPLLREVEDVVRVIGYWPTKTAFIREAILEKLEKYKKAKVNLS